MSVSDASARALRAALAAGAVAGLVGAASFWIFHTLWIAVTPFVLVEGALWGLAAGAATGWAFHQLEANGRVPPGWRGGVALGLALWLLLAPFEAIGLVAGPLTHLTRPVEMAALAPVGLLSALLAAGWAWRLTRRGRTVAACVVAVALGQFVLGGSIAYFGGRGVVMGIFLWMLPTYLVAGLVLVRARGALLAAWSRAPQADGDARDPARD